jgi:hypothetical protein
MFEFEYEEGIFTSEIYCIIDLAIFDKEIHWTMRLHPSIVINQYDPDANVMSIELCPTCHTNDFLDFNSEWGFYCPNCDRELREEELEVVYD